MQSLFLQGRVGAGGKREEKESDLEREGQSDKEKSLAERLWEKERGRW